VWTVLRKELKELLRLHGSGKRTLLLTLLPLCGAGALFAVIWSKELLNSPAAAVLCVAVPMGMVVAVICDSFAGERERHTLETLLSSRLPDSAILLGKIGATMAFGWVLTLELMGFMQVTVLIVKGAPESWSRVLAWHGGALAVGLPLWGFWGSMGVLASLRAPTVKRAQQTLGLVFLFVCLLPMLLAVSAGMRRRIEGALGSLKGVNPGIILAGVVLFLALVDVVLMLIAMARFKRSKLILD